MYINNIQRENHTYIIIYHILIFFYVCPRSCDVFCGMSPGNQNMPSPKEVQRWHDMLLGFCHPAGPGRWDGQSTFILGNQIPKCYHDPNVDP